MGWLQGESVVVPRHIRRILVIVSRRFLLAHSSVG